MPVSQLPPLSEQEFKLLQEFIQRETKITLGKEKMYLMRSRLGPILQKEGLKSYRELYDKLTRDRLGKLKDEVVEAITTNETFWFRDEHPFRILREEVIPEVLERYPNEKIRIWSAACSTGQEPYSIAISILEESRRNRKINPKKFEILATDISREALAVAQAGKYQWLALTRGMKPEILDRYFIKDRSGADAATVKPEVRQMVTFKQLNLQQSFTTLGKFHIIFCRNVTIYFSKDFKEELFKKMAGVLKPHGFLFLGASETMIGTSASKMFKLVRSPKGGTYYRLIS